MEPVVGLRLVWPISDGDFRMCGIVGILGRGPVAGSIVDALKRLEYRGYHFRWRGDARKRQAGAPAGGGQAQKPGGETCRGAAWRGDRHRPHALGDARETDRNQRPSARLAEACGRPQRHHREFPGVAPGAGCQTLSLRHRDRFPKSRPSSSRTSSPRANRLKTRSMPRSRGCAARSRSSICSRARRIS